jgi:hypothetical protein
MGATFEAALLRDCNETVAFLRWALGLAEGELGVARQEVVDFWRKRGGGNTYGKRVLGHLVRVGAVEYDSVTQVVTGVKGEYADEEEGAGADEKVGGTD